MSSDSSKEDIIERILDVLEHTKKHLGVHCKKNNNIPSCFTELIENIYEKYQQKVVILIDEYDKPILDNITDKKTALIAREILKRSLKTIYKRLI